LLSPLVHIPDAMHVCGLFNARNHLSIISSIFLTTWIWNVTIQTQWLHLVMHSCNRWCWSFTVHDPLTHSGCRDRSVGGLHSTDRDGLIEYAHWRNVPAWHAVQRLRHLLVECRFKCAVSAACGRSSVAKSAAVVIYWWRCCNTMLVYCFRRRSLPRSVGDFAAPHRRRQQS
jgi:hypothetical protein